MYNKALTARDRTFLLSYFLVMNVSGYGELDSIYIHPIGSFQSTVQLNLKFVRLA